MSLKAGKESIAFTHEIDLPPAMSAVFLIAIIILVKRGRLGGNSEMPLLPFRRYSVSGIYVCMWVSQRNI
jgi:hypothetical protein